MNGLRKIFEKEKNNDSDLQKIMEYTSCSSCFRLFPSCYYSKYSPEKLRVKGEKCIAKLEKIVEDYQSNEKVQE